MERQELTAFVPTADPSRTRRTSAFFTPGRDIATLASVQILCFLALGLHDRPTRLCCVAWSGVRGGPVRFGRGTLAEFRKFQPRCKLRWDSRAGHGRRGRTHDRTLPLPLGEGIFRARASLAHVPLQPRNRNGVLRHLASVVLGHDPQRVTAPGHNVENESS